MERGKQEADEMQAETGKQSTVFTIALTESSLAEPSTVFCVIRNAPNEHGQNREERDSCGSEYSPSGLSGPDSLPLNTFKLAQRSITTLFLCF